jgi:hypothetical protein
VVRAAEKEAGGQEGDYLTCKHVYVLLAEWARRIEQARELFRLGPQKLQIMITAILL